MSDNDRETPSGGRRLIEEWLPIGALGIESVRERTPMTPYPAPNRLHVWWARRPLVASRAAIMGALLPAGADRDKFLHMLGIHGDPVAAKSRILAAAEDIDPHTGKRRSLGLNPYGYARAFQHLPTHSDLEWLHDGQQDLPKVLDPTAGGGSIPFEAIRLGCATVANDLSPVAWLILKATVDFPASFGVRLHKRYLELGKRFQEMAEQLFDGIFTREPEGVTVDGYLWARTIACPYCAGIVPLSPNWRLDNKGTGVRLVPEWDGDKPTMTFEIVSTVEEQSPGTVKGGHGLCPYPECGRVIDGDEIKSQAQAGAMGEQLYAVVYKEEVVVGQTLAGKPKKKKVRGFRAPRREDDVQEAVAAALAEKMPEWQARGIVPDEERYIGPADRSALYGIRKVTDLFSPRQLYGHCTSVEVFRDMVEELGGAENLTDLDKAAMTYLAIAVDKLVDWNSLACTWELTKQRMGHTFARHDFAFRWSYAEMAPTITGLGYDWAVKQTGKSLKELIDLSGGEGGGAQGSFFSSSTPGVTVTCESADALRDVDDRSVDAVVMDPPYYDNVMYAELADFFYVWLKRTAGVFYPEQFSSYLTDKDREAVANQAKFADFTRVKGTGGARKRATRDYQERMQAIFSECRRVLKSDGVMVLMFTHKASGAWDALTKGLLEAGFVITASWPVNTEAEGSLNIRDKNAARSTIFLVCRPRVEATDGEAVYWESVEPQVAGAVKERIVEFAESGIHGVDLYLASFGPALEVISRHWPMTRGKAQQRPAPARGAQLKLIEDDEWDPYAVRPEDALTAARVAVKEWRLDQLTTVKRHAHLDPVTEFFVLAWDAYESPQFPADEALQLSRVVGVSFDDQLRGRFLELKGSNVILWDSMARAQKGAIGSARSGCLLDVLHGCARLSRERNTGAARDWLEREELLDDQALMLALEAVLRVLPSPNLADSARGPLAAAAADCRALEALRRLAFAMKVPQPEQLNITFVKEE